MKKVDSPYLADWFAISMRWLILFGLTISLAIGGTLIANHNQPNLIVVGVLVLPALWNGGMSVLAIYNRRIRWHRYINVILDAIFSLTLFALAGGLRSEVMWIALLPIFTGAIYFEARGALPAAVAMSLLQITFTYLQTVEAFQPATIGMVLGFNLTAGVLVALLSAPLIGSLRRTYQNTLNQRKENEKNAQRQERDRMRSLFQLVETLSATLNYQTVLETLMSTSEMVLEIDPNNTEPMPRAVFLFGDNNKLEMHASHGFVTRDASIELPAEEGVLSEVFKSGETRLVAKPAEDPELNHLMTLQDAGSVICIPLIRGMNAYGVMLFAHASADFFTAERVENLQMLANQAVISIQNARLYQDLSHEKERILQSQEEAQKKLARNLHDGPTQSVSAIAMRLSIARRLMQQSPEEAEAELQKIEDLARRTTQEIRHMLFTLRPLVLESEGLIPALQSMADKMRDLFQQKVVIDATGEVVDQMDATQQTTAFFLAEEAVNNARKHAQASEIWVRIKPAANLPSVVTLDIIDNGVGFDVEAVMSSYDRRGSLGMINLNERTDLINGIIKIDSIPGKGTRIRIFIPLDEEAADRLRRNK